MLVSLLIPYYLVSEIPIKVSGIIKVCRVIGTPCHPVCDCIPQSQATRDASRIGQTHQQIVKEPALTGFAIEGWVRL
jgi:hypothetical protein